jgi:hypothetical protein
MRSNERLKTFPLVSAPAHSPQPSFVAEFVCCISGWSCIGMNIVEGLGSTVLTIGATMSAAFTPSKYVGLAHTIANGVTSAIRRPGGEQTRAATQASTPTPEGVFDDPALDQLDPLKFNLTLLLALTQGKDGSGPDWDDLHTKKAGDRDSITCVQTQFHIVGDALDTTRPQGSFSFDMRKIVEEALKVCKRTWVYSSR